MPARMSITNRLENDRRNLKNLNRPRRVKSILIALSVFANYIQKILIVREDIPSKQAGSLRKHRKSLCFRCLVLETKQDLNLITCLNYLFFPGELRKASFTHSWGITQ